MTKETIVFDRQYTYVFHSPGEEPWVCGLLKNRNLNRVLDLGCGLGTWGFLLRTYISPNAEVTGVDISAERIERLRRLNIYQSLIVGDATALNISGEFDAIMVGELLHGLKDKKRFLDKFEGKLAKNGLLIIVGPSDGGLRKALLKRGYSVYEYYFKGFVLFNAKTRKTTSMYKTRENRLLAMVFNFVRRLFYNQERVHIIAFKETK